MRWHAACLAGQELLRPQLLAWDGARGWAPRGVKVSADATMYNACRCLNSDAGELVVVTETRVTGSGETQVGLRARGRGAREGQAGKPGVVWWSAAVRAFSQSKEWRVATSAQSS